jgi:hypothetical protein
VCKIASENLTARDDGRRDFAHAVDRGDRLLPESAWMWPSLCRHSVNREADGVRKIAHDARAKSQHLAGRFCTPYDAGRVLPLGTSRNGSEGGGRPSILAMDLAPAAALGPIGSRNPDWTIVILPMASFAALTKVKLSSTAEVLKVFHQPL